MEKIDPLIVTETELRHLRWFPIPPCSLAPLSLGGRRCVNQDPNQLNRFNRARYTQTFPESLPFYCAVYGSVYAKEEKVQGRNEMKQNTGLSIAADGRRVCGRDYILA